MTIFLPMTRLASGIALSTGILGACTTSLATEGHYQGVLHLKGSAPLFTIVLEEKHGKQWQLMGVDRNIALKLQNQEVELEGRPSAEKPVILPILNVIKIKELTKKP